MKIRATPRRALTVVLALVAAPAWADRVAVAPPKVSGSPASIESLRASVAGGLAASGLETVPPTELDRQLTPALAACDTDVCLRKLGQLVGARAVVRSTIEVLGSSNFSFRVELFDLEAGKIAASVEDTCSICTAREANESLSRVAASLGRRLGAKAQRPATVAATQPSAAPTPTGSSPSASSTSQTSSASRTISTPRSRLFLGLGVASAILGVGALGGGAALIALDGRARDDGVAGSLPQQDVFHGLVPGAVLVSAGGLLVAGAGVLLWRSHATRAPAR